MLKLCLLPLLQHSWNNKTSQTAFFFFFFLVRYVLNYWQKAFGFLEELQHAKDFSQLQTERLQQTIWVALFAIAFCWLRLNVYLFCRQMQNLVWKHNCNTPFQNIKRFTNESLRFLHKQSVSVKGLDFVFAVNLPFHINEDCGDNNCSPYSTPCFVCFLDKIKFLKFQRGL